MAETIRYSVCLCWHGRATQEIWLSGLAISNSKSNSNTSASLNSMPMTSVRLRPGVNTMMTPSQNEAGVSQANLVRYQQGMIQKYGGWSQYYPVSIGSTVRELLGWQGLTGNSYLGIGATQSLSVIISGANTDITPQTLTTNPTPSFSVSSGSRTVTIIDANSSASIFTTIYLNKIGRAHV